MGPARPGARDGAAPAPFGLGVAVALLAGVLLVQRFPALPPVAVPCIVGVVGLVAWRRRGAARWLGAAPCGCRRNWPANR